MKSAPTNVAASVRARLSNISKSSGEEFGLLLSRFAIERLLYRLSRSPHQNEFLLKGASLFALWPAVPRRPTRDVDFLGFGEDSPLRLESIFRALCEIEALEDGLLFLSDSVRVAAIREDQRYGGQRVHLEAQLQGARISLQVDVGFGDAVTPAPQEGEFPTLLPLPAPHLKFYPLETVIAEKWQAMVELGQANSRMKDFYDLWILSRHLEFDGALVAQAMRATFERRQTLLPTTLPIALRADFFEAQSKQTQWRAFLRKNRLEDAATLAVIAADLQKFLWPINVAASHAQPFRRRWIPGSGWSNL